MSAHKESVSLYVVSPSTVAYIIGAWPYDEINSNIVGSSVGCTES